MRACMCMDACVRTYVCVHGSGPRVDVECVRACAYAQIEGMVVFLILIGFCVWGELGEEEWDVRGLDR